MKKLILDYSKWRCGKDSEYYIDDATKRALGKGSTLLLNNSGFMCCLGQFSLQLNNSLTEQDILSKATPSDLNKEIPILSVFCAFASSPIPSYFNSELSQKAIRINDDIDTTIDQKITELKELFATVGYEIEVVNQPKTTENG